MSSVAVSLVVFVFYIIFLVAIVLVSYLFEAIGVSKIAKNRGFSRPWLAFIPFVSSYLLGAIADHIEADYGKKKNYRKILLVMDILSSVVSIVYLVYYSIYLVSLIEGENMYSPSLYNLNGLIPLLLINFLVVAPIAIITSAFTYIVLYKIYKEYKPSSATAFLVLSILFGLSPFFLFSIRNRIPISRYPYGYYNTNMAYQGNYTSPQWHNPPQPWYYQSPQWTSTQQPGYYYPAPSYSWGGFRQGSGVQQPVPVRNNPQPASQQEMSGPLDQRQDDMPQ